jgi:hypothetical protein
MGRDNLGAKGLAFVAAAATLVLIVFLAAWRFVNTMGIEAP